MFYNNSSAVNNSSFVLGCTVEACKCTKDPAISRVHKLSAELTMRISHIARVFNALLSDVETAILSVNYHDLRNAQLVHFALVSLRMEGKIVKHILLLSFIRYRKVSKS